MTNTVEIIKQLNIIGKHLFIIQFFVIWGVLVYKAPFLENNNKTMEDNSYEMY